MGRCEPENAGQDLGITDRVGPADHLPECLQLIDPLLRRIPGDERRVFGADRYTCNPVALDTSAIEALIDPCLVGTEGATTLQHQGDCLVIKFHCR